MNCSFRLQFFKQGPFGFLFLGNESPVPGNIASFGGDPSQVTLIGESAGAVSATSHLVAPGSHKYFSKVVANVCPVTLTSPVWTAKRTWLNMSGSILHPCLLKGVEVINVVGERTAAPVMMLGITAIHVCLVTLPAEDIQSSRDNATASAGADAHSQSPAKTSEIFHTIIGNTYSNGGIKENVSVIIGNVKNERTFWLPYYLSNSGLNLMRKLRFHNLCESVDSGEKYKESIHSLASCFANLQEAENILLTTYKDASPKENLKLQLRDGVAQLVGDLFFICSVNEFADLLAKNIEGSMYTYYFMKTFLQHLPPVNNTNIDRANPWPKWMAVHGSEIEYEFGRPFSNQSLYDQARYGSDQHFCKDWVREVYLERDYLRKVFPSPAPYWPTIRAIAKARSSSVHSVLSAVMSSHKSIGTSTVLSLTKRKLQHATDKSYSR
ncbi:unnamed protein product [Heligmosomoides polygyrus]|uniref:Carboxylic ester hydrolase n=1 Tax=Heligmosomoides polygyrus TaxID=6339 RepID=A0A183FK81_HELPZ|nr:unnamed protein product [Heligmosomoides polygyrus]